MSNTSLSTIVDEIAIASWDEAGFRRLTPVIVAVLDSGLDLDPPDLVGRIINGYDFVDDDTIHSDGFGRGTYVAGLIGAVLDNDVGIAGVARHVKLMPVRVVNDYAAGLSSNLAAGNISPLAMGSGGR